MRSFLNILRTIPKSAKTPLRQIQERGSQFPDKQLFLGKCNQPRSYLKYIGSTALVLLCVSLAQVAQASVTITRTSSPIFYMNDDNSPALRGMYVSYQITNTGGAINDAWVKLDMPVYGTAGIKVTLAQYEDGLVQLGTMQAGETKTAFFYVYTPQAMAGQNSSLAISESHTVRVYEGNPTSSGIQLSNSSFTFTEIQDTIDASANKANRVTITSSQTGDLLTVEVDGDAGNIGTPPVQSFSPAVFADWPASTLELVSTNVTYGTTSFINQLLFNFTSTNTLYTATYVFKIRGGSAGAVSLSPVGQIASGNQIKHTNTANFRSFILVNVSGKVWDDANNSANNTFTNINTGSEAGTNAGGLNAILVESTGNVLSTTPVAADGTYSLSVGANQSNVTIRLSTSPGTAGSAAPAASLPTNWIGTSPLTTAAFNIVTSNITGRDFGIEQLPNTTDVTASPQPNPGNTATVQAATLAGSDPEDGPLGTGKMFKILTLPTNGTLYYPNASNVPIAITAGQVISNYDPTKLTIDPNDGAITVSFTYAAIDAAGKEDPTPATAAMPFTVANAITCPVGSTATGSGYATGGIGQYITKNAIYWLDWSCGAITQFKPGDTVTKTWTAPNGISVTATVSNITKTLHPYNTGSWGGDKLDDLYTGVNPIGLRNLNASEDPSYKITFSMTLNGVPIPSDIVTAEAEDTGWSNESATWTTDGDPWQPLEAAPNSSLKTTFSNGGKTIYMDDNPDGGGGVLVALTENVSNITVNMNAGGNEAIAFGIMIPFDYGDAPATYGSASHYTRRHASGGSQPTTPTNVNSLTMATLSYNIPYLGAIGSDPEKANQPTANADGDKLNGDNDEDAFTTLPNIPASGTYSLNNIPVNNATGNPGTLYAWVDFNRNGVFEASEFTNTTVASNTTSANLSWTIPSSIATGTTYARFRLTTQPLTDDPGTPAVDERSIGVASDGEVEDYQVMLKWANVLLVKRITAINGINLNTYKDNTTDPRAADDNSPNWPAPLNTNAALGDTSISSFLRGAIDAGEAKPGDTIEYTIYFLNAGNVDASGVRICDRILGVQQLNGTTIELQQNNTSPTSLTSAVDGDRATFYPISSAATNCNFTNSPTADNGAVVVDVTGATGTPIWSVLTGSTGQSTPNSYGFIRFTTQVNP
jgi:hypothetical protein